MEDLNRMPETETLSRAARLRGVLTVAWHGLTSNPEHDIHIAGLAAVREAETLLAQNGEQPPLPDAQ